MDKKELLKTAAEKLRNLTAQNAELTEKLAHIEQVQTVLEKMIDSNLLDSPKDVLAKFAELRESSAQDLEVTEKAVQLGVEQQPTPELSKLGSLSDLPTGDGLDPLTRMLIEDL